MRPAETKYKRLIERLDQDTRTDLDEAYRTIVVEPLVRFCSYFTEVNEAIKHRQKIVASYDTSRAKVKKLMNRPNRDPQIQSCAEQEANITREAYQNLNTMLLNDLSQLIDLRIAYLDPSFEACIKSQLKLSQDSYGGFEKLKEYFPSHQEVVDHRVDQVIQQMRELTICGNL
ncbi:uncharacterized protein B0P05DRAFT_93188 [Gilbertella persicaria]|uniref:uncharacterized protein n=1 Tax=Gilbertella persicaria TaxID=101096 RepID=UPI00221EAFC1|nr:uncharacterized protein B0P05DRAFT_93188 [Gilbertella persicaria]KAI8097836.1 hypothetical protein B0P05DRAFT_93188 [Gilbertella persicaria]